MKHRITYGLRTAPPSFDYDPTKSLEVETFSLAVNNLDAAKEHQLTVGPAELPYEIWNVLKDCHELHLRWSTPRPYSTVSPFISRVGAGLHVFFTPLENKPVEHLCSLLKKLFGNDVDCDKPETSFITPPILSERFSTSSARHFFQYVPTITDLVQYLENKVCSETDSECKRQAQALDDADYLDADYDSISHTLIIKAFWTRPGVDSAEWTEKHNKRPTDTVEIGVLQSERASEREELKFSGYLTTLGQSTQPSRTVFETPSRHHPLADSSSASFTAKFKQPTGMHPTLTISLQGSSLEPPAGTCALHTYLTLPSFLFIDRYQLSDPLFLKSQNLKALHALSGATDLEAPDWVINEWGSAALLEFENPPASPAEGAWEASIPLHLRYLSPSDDTGHAEVFVPWPVVFWACTAEEGTKFAATPFDRVNLGYDGLFGTRTMFYHVPPGNQSLTREVLRVPVMDLGKSAYVETATVAVIAAGTLWVLWKLFSAVFRSPSPTAATAPEKAKDHRD